MPIIVIGAILTFFSAVVFYKWDKDTTEITTRAFAILATLSAISFSAAKIDLIQDDLKKNIWFGGICFFLSAILCILCSVNKYALFLALASKTIQQREDYKFALQATIGSLTGSLFTFANFVTIKGIAFLYEPLLYYFKTNLQHLPDPHLFDRNPKQREKIKGNTDGGSPPP